MQHHWAILLAAGSGRRMNGRVDDKVLAPLAGKPVFQHSLEAFERSGLPFRYVIVYRDAEQEAQLRQRAVECGVTDRCHLVRGGSERQDSVRNALKWIHSNEEADASPLVFIHDCARPLISKLAISKLSEAAEHAERDALCLAHRVVDTVKRLDCATEPVGGLIEGREIEDLDRQRLWAMETPQVFRLPLIVRAYEALDHPVTDDVAAVRLLGAAVCLVENTEPNPKLTRPEDLDWMEFLLERRKEVERDRQT